MLASEARSLTQQTEIENAKEWWSKFSSKLFEGIKKQTECRCYVLIIDHDHKLNDLGWITCKHLREKAISELEKLGYKVSFVDAYQGTYFEIDWQ